MHMISSVTKIRETLMTSMERKDSRTVVVAEVWTTSSACSWVDKEEEEVANLRRVK
jgi:hypothetical protein